MSEKNNYNKNLSELRSSGYEISDGEPDIRGWEIRTLQNQEIGKVKELLFDTNSLRVRYVVVHLDGKPLNLVSRDLLIPIGLAELHEKDKVVIFPEVSAGHFASLPEYKKGDVTIQCERNIRSVFAPSSGVVYKDEDYYDPEEFYKHEHFDESRMNKYRNRAFDNNSVDKSIPADKNLHERTMLTDRRGSNKEGYETGEKTGDDGGFNKPLQDTGFAPFQDGVIEIKEHSEVPVVSKETRVVEEVSINKEVTQRNEKIKDSVRRTEIDIEDLNKEDLSRK